MSPIQLSQMSGGEKCRSLSSVARAPQTRSRTSLQISPAYWYCRVLCAAVVLLVLAAAPATTLAAIESAPVRFDTAYLVSCRDVTTEEYSAANPHQRLVEARFHVTAMVADGQSSARMQTTYRLTSATGNVQIVNYEPHTLQSTALAGNVSIEKKKETNKSLGVSVSGSFESILRGTAGSDLGSKDTSQIRYELKPPMEAVLVAGTVQRGTGVYFKLLPSPETALEGSREFVVVMSVARQWRGDVMYVHCEAQEERRGKFVSLGVSRFVVGLYAEGDDDVRTAAEDLILTETTLRRIVAQRQREIDRRAIPTVVHKVGAILDVYDPRIPDTWLDRLIYGPTNISQYDFVEYLPDDVRRLADRYGQAKRRMCEFSGRRLAQRDTAQELGMR